MSTFLGWQCIFYIPFIALLAFPVILKCLPDNPKQKSNVDYIGFLILAIFSINVNFLISNPSIILLVTTIVLIVIFSLYIKKAKHPIVSSRFFGNKDYVITLCATFFYYLSQVALVFITPFLLQALFNYSLEKVSLIYIVPYTVSGIIAIFSGSVINKIGMKPTLTLGAILIIVGFVLGGCLSYIGVNYVIVVLTIITGGYALSFAPLLTRAITTLHEEEVGTGIGIFNFIVRVANALGISITAFLLNSTFIQTTIISLDKKEMTPYTNIFLFLALMTLIGIVIYLISYKKEEK